MALLMLCHVEPCDSGDSLLFLSSFFITSRVIDVPAIFRKQSRSVTRTVLSVTTPTRATADDKNGKVYAIL